MNVAKNLRELPDELAEGSRAFFRTVVSPLVDYINSTWPGDKPWAIRQLPNAISTFRLVAVVYVTIKLVGAKTNKQRWFWVAVGCGVLATDGVDGELARGTDTVSRGGKALDPVADKLFFAMLGIGLAVGLYRERKLSIFLVVALSLGVIHELQVMNIGLQVGARAQMLGKEPTGAVSAGKVKFGLQSLGVLGGWLIWGKQGGLFAACMIFLALPFSRASLKHHQEQLRELEQFHPEACQPHLI